MQTTFVLKLRAKYPRSLKNITGCSSDCMGKNLKIVLAVVLIVVIAVSGIFWFPALSRTLEPSHSETTTTATKVEQVIPQYLPGYGSEPTSDKSSGSFFETATRIFLVSTQTYYGYSNETIKSGNPAEGNIINKGDPVFIINATLRNDYNSANPLPLSTNNHAFIFLTATLYSSQNVTIKATDVSPTNPQVGPFFSAFVGLNSGVTASVEIWLSTASRNVENYTFNLDVFGIPPP